MSKNETTKQGEATTQDETNGTSAKRHEATRSDTKRQKRVNRRHTPVKRNDSKKRNDILKRSDTNRTELDDWKVGLTEKQIEVALFRHQIVSAVLAEPFRERGSKKAELVARDWEIPGSEKRRLTESTINRWITLWNQGGFRALTPKAHRRDYGTSRKLPLHVVELVKSVYLEGLNRPDRLRRSASQIISRVYTELAERGEEDLAEMLTERTVQRLIAPLQPSEQAAPTEKVVRFQAATPNELWQADFSHSRLHVKRGAGYGVPRLFAWMDDYSRCVMGFYQWGEAQVQADRSLMAALLGVDAGLCPELQRYSDAIPLRGKPAKMLVDNGKVYISRRMKLALADMEIMLIRATPYHAQTKGKIERFFREVHKFEAELTRFREVAKLNKKTGEEYTETEQEPYLTLSELNSHLGAWLAKYHTSQHKYDEVEGQVRVVPLDRWTQIERVIEVPEELLRRALLEETTRRVRSDRCISLRGRRYEVPELYLRRTILVRYDPEDLDTIWYYDITSKEPLGAGYPVGGLDNLTREEYRMVQEKDAERATVAEPEKPPVELVTGYTDTLKREGEDADTLAAVVPYRADKTEYQFKSRIYDSTSLDSVTAVDMLERKFNRALDRDERELVYETLERERILPEVFERTISAAMLDRAAQMHVRVFIDRLLEAMRAARLAAAEETDKKDESKRIDKGWVFER